MSFKDDRNTYLNIAKSTVLTDSEKEEEIAREFYEREKGYNMKNVSKLASWIQKETGFDMSAEKLWSIINDL